ncbi:MAG: hypothetical protein WBQ94_02720, partial [Terracidiphilus sp.]
GKRWERRVGPVAGSYQGNSFCFDESGRVEQGISLKKCDLPDSSYGKFEIAAGLNTGSCGAEPRTN